MKFYVSKSTQSKAARVHTYMLYHSVGHNILTIFVIRLILELAFKYPKFTQFIITIYNIKSYFKHFCVMWQNYRLFGNYAHKKIALIYFSIFKFFISSNIKTHVPSQALHSHFCVIGKEVK